MKSFLPFLAYFIFGSFEAASQIDTAGKPACQFGFLLQQRRLYNAVNSPQSPQFRPVETSFRQRSTNSGAARSAVENSYTLPIVVHVIHNGEAIGTPNNPSDAVIQAMIAQLNAAFRKDGASYGGVTIGIQFQLAVRSPQCNSTTGINRVNGSGVPNYASGGIAVVTSGGSADERAVKALSRWPNTDFINIWIVNKINGNPNAGGFAWYPEYNSALDDGITICASSVDGTNKTIVHEMGHIFNLHHTFDDGAFETTCPSSSSCATTGDLICDTEPVRNVPCSTTLNSCTGAPFQIADASLNYTVLNNYMGYTDCQWMFTQGQKDRMRAALLAFRPGLLTSGGLSAPTASPVLACSVSAANGLSPNYGIARFTLNSLDVYSNTAVADGTFYVDRTCNQRTTLTAGQSYSLTIQGAYDNYQYLQAYLDYNADGDFADAGETLISTAAGNVTTVITIPTTTTVRINKPLRLRIVADTPGDVAPTACTLSGNVANGVGQVEDYTVVVQPRSIVSVASGSWTATSTWSCSCVPGLTDVVSIQTGHIISISSGLKQAWALKLSGRLSYVTGGRLQLTSN